MEVLHEEKQLHFFPWVNKQQEGREISVRGCSATCGERKKNLRGWRVHFSFPFRSQLLGGMCVEAWTDSPATPLPKQLTAITSLSYQQKLLTEGGWDKTKWEDTWIFNPLAKAGQFPHPYPCENHAPFDLVGAAVAGCVHFNYRCIFTGWPI